METRRTGRLLERRVEVDAARLLLLLNQFAWQPDDRTKKLACYPKHPVSRVLSPEYYLQKLDFLVRNPAYLAYELVELHRLHGPLGLTSAADGEAIKGAVQEVMMAREPERRTDLYRRFMRGAYEPLDRVEAWWQSRQLVYVGYERRGPAGSGALPWKLYFLSPKGEEIARLLVSEVEHAAWYDRRIALIRCFFGSLTPTQLKGLQYSHASYREAQWEEMIPSLPVEDIAAQYEQVFGETITIPEG